MFTKRHYSFWMTLNWSRKPLILGALYAIPFAALAFFTNWDLSLPWQPVSVLGIAVAFYLGFKNNSSYDRTWEARKIWGGIVNNSRSFGAALLAYVQGENAEAERKQLIYRHVAWLTALRYQLRLSREWEHTEERIKGLYMPTICEQYLHRLDAELMAYIPESEWLEVKGKANMATQIMAIQARELERLHRAGFFDNYKHVALQNLLNSFYDEQGKSECIKNFPFPRQYASAALWTTVTFSLLVPSGLLGIFAHENSWRIWLTIPFSGFLIWVFFLMEKIGDYSENPFEGTYNDIPITAISRAIEIDLREMIGDKDIPGPIPAQNGFLM